ncbi:serine O-acetyltransferase [Campylobacter sp. MOP7]|uniref:serine O-acetyltransferase n=1 Tax=Campylobacter canis TaxID=3378588 RepID=UPI00387ED42C
MSRIIWFIYFLSHASKNIKFISYTFVIINRFVFSIYISPLAKIDHTVKFCYQGLGIVIGGDSEVGANCEIGQNVTIGGRYSANEVKKGYPKIMHNTFIGPGSAVLGPILIEDNVIVGANSTVIKNVSRQSIVVGSPAKRIKIIKKRLEGDKYEI